MLKYEFNFTRTPGLKEKEAIHTSQTLNDKDTIFAKVLLNYRVVDAIIRIRLF